MQTKKPTLPCLNLIATIADIDTTGVSMSEKLTEWYPYNTRSFRYFWLALEFEFQHNK